MDGAEVDIAGGERGEPGAKDSVRRECLGRLDYRLSFARGDSVILDILTRAHQSQDQDQSRGSVLRISLKKLSGSPEDSSTPLDALRCTICISQYA